VEEKKKNRCCSRSADPFTEDELEILRKLRALHEESKGIKAKLNELEDPVERTACESRLNAIRDEWKTLKLEGEEARKRRMILLGHLDPDGETGQ
jgi:hypothetical protein